MFLCSYGRSCSLSPVDVWAGFKPAHTSRIVARMSLATSGDGLVPDWQAQSGLQDWLMTSATGSWAEAIASPALGMPLPDAWAAQCVAPTKTPAQSVRRGEALPRPLQATPPDAWATQCVVPTKPNVGKSALVRERVEDETAGQYRAQAQSNQACHPTFTHSHPL